MSSSELSEANMPTVHQPWIYSMIVLGFIGFICLLFTTSLAVYKTYRSKTKNISKILVVLTFTLFTFNTISCFQWAFFRTDLFINLNPLKCTIIYISNYLFYMLAKYCLHLLLLYRLWLVFKGTPLHLNTLFASIFASIITIDFLIFVSLWLNICIQKVSVGIIVPSKSLHFCTLYNNSTANELTLFQKVWPVLFGGQDFIVGILTLSLFLYKLKQLSGYNHDMQTERLVRKLFTMGVISIFSTFTLFTFAIPFYSNLTFLLPLDALINSLCVLFLLDWANKIYVKLCCGFDIILQTAFKHESTIAKRDKSQNYILENGINLSTLQSEATINTGTARSNISNAPSNTPNLFNNVQSNSNVLSVIVANSNSKQKTATPDTEHHGMDMIYSSSVNVLNDKEHVHKHVKAQSDILHSFKQKVVNPLPLSESRFIQSSPLLL